MKWFGRLPDTWKVVLAALGLIGLGATIGALGLSSLPAQVKRHETEIRDLSEWRGQHTREFRSLVCLLTLADSVDTRERLRECGL